MRFQNTNTDYFRTKDGFHKNKSYSNAPQWRSYFQQKLAFFFLNRVSQFQKMTSLKNLPCIKKITLPLKNLDALFSIQTVINDSKNSLLTFKPQHLKPICATLWSNYFFYFQLWYQGMWFLLPIRWNLHSLFPNLLKLSVGIALHTSREQPLKGVRGGNKHHASLRAGCVLPQLIVTAWAEICISEK